MRVVPITFADTLSIKYLIFYSQWFSRSIPSDWNLRFQVHMHNIWYTNTEAITWRKQNIINKGLEFTKHYNYSLEKCSWSTPLLLPTILQNCVFVIKLCIPRIAINIEKEHYFFMSINFKHKELILCPQISINDFNTLWAFSCSIKYTFHS